MGLSPDGSKLAAVTSDGVLEIFDSKALVRRFRDDTLVVGVNDVVWVKSTGGLITASHDGSLRLWDPDGGGCRLTVMLNTTRDGLSHSQLADIAVDSSGSVLATGGHVGMGVGLWNLSDMTLIQDVPTAVVASSGEFSPDGQYLVTADENGKNDVWRLDR